MRPLRAARVLALGALVGVAGAAAFVRRAVPSRGDETSDDVALVAACNGIDLASRSQAFRGGSVLAILGGVSLDLREATLAPGATLSVHALLGGVAIRTPAEWRVELRAHALFGGVAAPGRSSVDDDAPTLVVDGLAALGGIAVGPRVGKLSD
jgi:hypothetical protein